MAQDSSILQLGDIIQIEWPTDDSKDETYDVEIIKIKEKSHKRKFSLRFQDFMDNTGSNLVRKCDLLQRKWVLISSSSSKEEKPDDIQVSKKRKQSNDSFHIVYNPIVKKEYRIPDCKYIVAPMVGGSELAFRLLCRQFGATLAYTPMINSNRFAFDEAYRQEQFQTISSDRPLVAHFAANSSENILLSAKYVENECDAIDINLGCPQRVAYTGHFGSFLLDEVDRPLVLDIVNTLATALSIPIFVKIRLLDTVEDTVRLCEQLIQAGASLIAIHGRYRVNLVGRTGPGARDGPAHLDQIQSIIHHIKPKYPHIIIITNGNTIDSKDVHDNLSFTNADGIMSAEGILDNPALYHPSDKPIHPLILAKEYLHYVTLYPISLKTIIFHTRRICRDMLSRYLLIEELINAASIENIHDIIIKMETYDQHPEAFIYDKTKEKQVKDAIERRKQNESKRKEYEARMIRKAKREGKDMDYYLKLGSELPSYDELHHMKTMSKDESFKIWKEKHSQHCYAYHFDPEKCPRERTCGFLHADVSYSEAVAYG